MLIDKIRSPVDGVNIPRHRLGAMCLRRILFPHNGVPGESCQDFISQQLFDSAIPESDKVLMAGLLANLLFFQTTLPQKIPCILNNFHTDIESVHPPPSFLCLIYKITFLMACQEGFTKSPAYLRYATGAPGCGSGYNGR